MLMLYFLALGVFVDDLVWIVDGAHSHAQPAENTIAKKNNRVVIDFLNAAEIAVNNAKQYAAMDARSNEEQSSSSAMDCAEIQKRNPFSTSGIYEVWPHNRIIECPISVYCDMEDDGGGWTVIQRRGDFDSPKDYFYRDWASYKTGFGDLLKDFWLGNDNIFALTNQRANSVKFTLSDWEANNTYATYDDFWIDNESNNYISHISGYRGTAGDSFSYTNGQPFTTKDRDNDKHDKNCADLFKGASWYTSCHSSNINGLYLKGVHESYADGVEWSSFRGQHYSLKDVVMKIRPKNYRKASEFNITPL